MNRKSTTWKEWALWADPLSQLLCLEIAEESASWPSSPPNWELEVWESSFTWGRARSCSHQRWPTPCCSRSTLVRGAGPASSSWATCWVPVHVSCLHHHPLACGRAVHHRPFCSPSQPCQELEQKIGETSPQILVSGDFLCSMVPG